MITSFRVRLESESKCYDMVGYASDDEAGSHMGTDLFINAPLPIYLPYLWPGKVLEAGPSFWAPVPNWYTLKKLLAPRFRSAQF